MSNSLRIRLKSTVLSANMLVCVSMGVITLIWYLLKSVIDFNRYIGSLSLFETGAMFLQTIYESHARSGFDLFAPVFAVLPAATMFCDDYNSGYLKMILIRSDRNRYVKETVICSSVAGGMAVFLPCFLTSIFFLIIGKPNIENDSTYLDESIFADIQYIWGGVLVALILLIFAFLFGAVWSNIGLCISALIPNRYLALAAPFALYFALHLFCYRINSLVVLSPVNMVMPIGVFMPNIVYPLAYQGMLFMVAVQIYRKMVFMRIHNV